VLDIRMSLQRRARSHINFSKLEAIVLAPLLDDSYKVFNLWVRGAFKHLDNFDKSFFLLLASDSHLENSEGSSTLSLPKLWVCVKSLQYIKCLN